MAYIGEEAGNVYREYTSIVSTLLRAGTRALCETDECHQYREWAHKLGVWKENTKTKASCLIWQVKGSQLDEFQLGRLKFCVIVYKLGTCVCQKKNYCEWATLAWRIRRSIANMRPTLPVDQPNEFVRLAKKDAERFHGRVFYKQAMDHPPFH